MTRAAKKETAKPAMPAMFGPWVDEARAKHFARPPAPGVVFEQEVDGRWQIGSPYGDREAWEVMICEAFGTRSHATMWTFLDQLRALMGDYHNGTAWVPDDFAVTAAINIVKACQPENEIQAALAAQMVAVHFLTMKAAKATAGYDTVDPRDISMVSKLARTYAMQAETLGKLQGKVKTQHITVSYERHEHHHTHVHDERHVHLSGGGPGNGGQGYGPAHGLPAGIIGDASRAPLSGPHAAGDALSEAGDQGAPPVPVARLRERVRRTQGGSERQLSDGIVDGRGRGAASAGVRRSEVVA